MEKKLDILQGTLDLMVLQVLASMGAQHGYSIAARLEQIADQTIQINMGTLYPALVRLELRGFIRANWNTTENNRRARFYELTPRGRKHMETKRNTWLQTAALMSKILELES